MTRQFGGPMDTAADAVAWVAARDYRVDNLASCGVALAAAFVPEGCAVR